MKILIKFATRGRREKAISHIENILATVSNNVDFSLEVTVDYDDEHMKGLTGIQLGDKIHVSYGYSNDKIDAINRDMSSINKRVDWDILVNTSDDMQFIEKNWDQRLVDIVTKLGTTDCFLHFNDGFVGDKLPTMSIMGREYYNRFFYIYPPCYKSFSCDAEAMFVAQMLGKWHYFSDIIFKHLHPANVGGGIDTTYHRANQHSQEDTKVYFERLKKYFYVNNPVTIPELMKPHL